MSAVHSALSANRGVSHYGRLVLGLLLGAAATLFLAWFMHYLIKSSDVGLANATRVQMLDFVRVKREENADRKDRTPERPELNKSPDVPPMPDSQMDSGEQLAVSVMPLQTSVEISQGGVGFGAGEGDYLPIVKVAPIFPQRALAR
jgi:protein TonB